MKPRQNDHVNAQFTVSSRITHQVVIKMIRIVRLFLGSIIALLNLLTRGFKKTRTPEEQQKVELATSNFALYQFNLCPFCIKTRRLLHQLNLPIELRDAKNSQQWRNELLAQGGKIQVPCLRIEQDDEITWMYESSKINQFLSERFSA